MKSMDPVEARLHRLSPNQLRALQVLAKSEHGIVSSTASGGTIGITGKPLGGVFSSLVRQKIHRQALITAWGKAEDGRGLRWKLNEKLITKKRLLTITSELLEY